MLNAWKAIVCSLATVGALSLATAAGAQTLERVQQAGVVNLGYLTGSAPFSDNAGGKPSGYAIDICNHVVGSLKTRLNRSDLQVNYVASTEQESLAAVAEGRVDLFCGPIAESLHARETVSFSTPFFAGGIGAAVRNDAPTALLKVLNGEVARSGPTWRATVNQGIANHTYAVRMGAISADEVREKIRQLGVVVKVIEVPTTAEGLKAVAVHKADAFFDDRRALEAGLKLAANSPVQLIQRYFTVGPYAMVLARGDEDFRLAVDTAISQLMNSPEFITLFSNYFGAPSDSARLLINAYSLPQ